MSRTRRQLDTATLTTLLSIRWPRLPVKQLQRNELSPDQLQTLLAEGNRFFSRAIPDNYIFQCTTPYLESLTTYQDIIQHHCIVQINSVREKAQVLHLEKIGQGIALVYVLQNGQYSQLQRKSDKKRIFMQSDLPPQFKNLVFRSGR